MGNKHTQEIIGKEFQCLDKGFIRLIEIMGNDSSIVQAARVSYGKGTKSIREDRSLIRYLMRHSHTSPFEMVELKFHIRLPIFVARQWIRHRTANVNEYSGRYSEMTSDFYLPGKNQLRTQSTINKQGRSDDLIDESLSNEVIKSMETSQKNSYDEYIQYINQGIAREIARINLPLSSYTEWYWKIDLHNLFRFLKLRLDVHAQYEIRVYAETIANILKQILPISFEAFEDYMLNSITFSSSELYLLKEVFNKVNLKLISDDENILSNTELNEFIQKVTFINENILNKNKGI